ncbi:MAG TPA: heme lyase CcmF/NrfE family subunit [Anaerolineae bacterium]|nr:heme lyase CcmF/NrfE family subunit [Anaerolineae bacterium]
MIANVGCSSLAMAFLAALYGAIAAAYGARRARPRYVESARHAMLLTWPLVTVSALAIIWLLVSGDYQIHYVASVTSNSMPTYLKVTALWGGQAGSLVFWSWLMAAFASAAGIRKWHRDRELLPWVVVVTMVTLAFFLGLVVFFENPFARLWLTPEGRQVTALFQPRGTTPLIPSDGQGLNPLLRHPGMIIHPPTLYLGFVSFVVPYAFAIAALVTGRTDDRWVRITRRWTLVAWLFLSLGLILGGRWAYDVLGWGGYWGWDPVEIAALMPWLTGTAFLHSVMVQEKKGMLKRWNVILIILTYALVIFGTFLTRSGVLSSVHAFAQSAIGPLFFLFIGVTFVASLSLLIKRWDDLKSENQLGSIVSREALFLFNNLLFMGILAVCFWGVIFPLISELFTGQKVTVGPPFYERANSPLGIGLLLLMAIAPLSVFGQTSWKLLGRALWKPLALSFMVPFFSALRGTTNLGALLGYWVISLITLVTLYEFWRGALARRRRHGESLPVALWKLTSRNRRRYGGYVIHLGVVLMVLGVIGIEIFQTETQGTLVQGEQLTLDRYTMIYESLTQFDTQDGRNVTRAVVSVFRDGKNVGELYPRRDFYYSSQQPMTIPGVRSTLEDDFYVLLVGWESIGLSGATFKVYHNPLVNFLWIGGLVFILGTMVAAWPDRGPEPVLKLAKKRAATARSKIGGLR